MAPLRNVVAETADLLAPISLDELDRYALLNRVDTKFVLTQAQLIAALRAVSDSYRILTIDNVRLHRYETLYFDTPDFALYHHHHSGGLNRYKIRFRRYVDSGPSFLEVKLRSNKGRTEKARLLVDAPSAHFQPVQHQFLAESWPGNSWQLEPKVWNSFRRLTLANRESVERLTIDVGLGVQRSAEKGAVLPGERNGTRATSLFGNIVIAEVKQPKRSLDSPFMQQIRQLGLRPSGFSKYCMGAAALYPRVRQNRFKPRFRMLEKLRQD